VLLIGKVGEVPDLAKVPIISRPRNVSWPTFAPGVQPAQSPASQAFQSGIDDRLKMNSYSALRTPDDRAHLQGKPCLREFGVVVAEFQIEAVDEVALSALGATNRFAA